MDTPNKISETPDVSNELTPEREWEIEFHDTNTEIQAMEAKMGMSSEEFHRKWLDGSMPDTFENNVWAILIQSRETLLKNKP